MGTFIDEFVGVLRKLFVDARPFVDVLIVTAGAVFVDSCKHDASRRARNKARNIAAFNIDITINGIKHIKKCI